MTWQTNTFLILVRKVGRRFGLNRFFAQFVNRDSYEEAFDTELFENIKEGDVVWDVGANIGYYTKKFSAAVGKSGGVVAFEPFPSTAATLKENVKGVENTNVEITISALADSAGTLVMEEGTDNIAATSKIVNSESSEGVAIAVTTGDSFIREKNVQCPNILKIDTEGYELEVLKGMSHLMDDNNVRGIFVEVHFGILADRGMPNAPKDIEKLLASKGFAVSWIDSSHVVGLRV